MWPQYFWSGGFWIIPLLMMVIMLLAMHLFFGRGMGGFCGRGHFHGGSSNDTQLDIAKRRYAKGEINKHEFEELTKDLAVWRKEDKLSEKQAEERPRTPDMAGPGGWPMCGGPGEGQMMQGMGPMGLMAKMPAMCMAFMVTVPALLDLGVGFAIGRGAKSR